MVNEVIMPALGMTQDTGKLVKWYKNVGDKVSADDILMEVETDKSAMEIEAGSDGILTATLAEAGEDVPVGKVIAIISKEAESDSDASTSKAPTQTKIEVEKSLIEPKVEADAKSKINAIDVSNDKRVVSTIKSNSRKILASPKAKSEAQHQKISLKDLRADGYQEPILYSDVEKFTNEKKPITEKTLNYGSNFLKDELRTPFSCLTLVADVNGERLFEMADKLGLSNHLQDLLCCLVAGAYRVSMGDLDSSLNVKVMSDQENLGVLVNPDKVSFEEVLSQDKNLSNAHDIVVVDLTHSVVTTASPSIVQVPEIWITKNVGEKERMLSFTVAFMDDKKSRTEAINFLDELVKRVQVPLYHIV